MFRHIASAVMPKNNAAFELIIFNQKIMNVPCSTKTKSPIFLPTRHTLICGKCKKISVRFLDNIKICHILERKNENLALWVGLPCNYFPSPNKTVLRQQLLCLSACLQNKHNFFYNDTTMLRFTKTISLIP